MSCRHHGRYRISEYFSSSGTFDLERWRRDRRLRALGEGVHYKPYGYVSDHDDDGNATEKPVAPPKKEAILQVESVDFLIGRNTIPHRTYDYDAVLSTSKTPKLIVRRGQPFNISVTFNRKYDKSKDELKLVFEIGDCPVVTKGTEVLIILSDKDEPGKWGAKIDSQSGNTLNLTIFTAPTCIVGRWKFSIDVLRKSDKETEIFSYNHKDRICILFNPWCKDDLVYFPSKTGKGPDSEALDEYVLNESGKIYAGHHKRMSMKPWNFGQFEEGILECIMWLLEKKMPDAGRGNPVMVSRKLSALINAPDDSGVLIGNWSGDYSGGTSPTEWTGSVAILEEFYKTKSPVRFGQCWVFSGLLTTALRAIGIPARSVTNFASAHDSDGSITIDCHFNFDGDELKEYNRDSVWNFHVWNEAYMARPKLPAGYGGWQACDATPQEASDGVYCCGPVSVAAVRNGEVMYPYDGPFVFAEVNADKIYWVVKKDGDVVKSRVVSQSIGKKISSKKPGRRMSGMLRCIGSKDDPDRDDLTLQYKHPEGSDAERAAVARANQTCSTITGAYDCESKDVKFTLVDLDEFEYGKAFNITLKLKNIAKEKRTITGKLNVSSVFYTGLHASLIKCEEINVTLDVGKEKQIKMNVSYSEYGAKIVQHCMLKHSALCYVKETMEVFTDQDDFRLVKPDLAIKVPNEVKIGRKIKAEISFTNPLPVPLTECVLVFEGAGLRKPLTQKQSKVSANGKFTSSVELTPHRAGERNLMANFNSKELEGINGAVTIRVSK